MQLNAYQYQSHKHIFSNETIHVLTNKNYHI